MKKLLALITFAAITHICKAQNVDASYSPPGGLTPAQSPVFVVIGWDDNGFAGYSKSDPQGIKWIADFTRNLKNPGGTNNPATFDGTAARSSFYVNSMYGEGYFSSEDPVLNKRAWHQLLIDGHEIGNHTRAHLEGANLWTAQQWDTAISKCTDYLIQPWDANEQPGGVDTSKGIGIPKNQIYGFRSPFLVYNQLVFETVKKNGMLYDCSHEHLISDTQDGTAQTYQWPYTLHAGTQGTPKLNVTIDSLWEIPVYEYQIPTSVSGTSSVTSITGFDYNLITDTVKKYTKEQLLAIFNYNLDQRIAGNHAPLTIGCHPDYYTSSYDQALAAENFHVATNYKDRQWVFEEFIKYALSKQDVRIVTAIDLINWMKNPVALGQAVTGTYTLNVTAGTGGTVTFSPDLTEYNAGDTVTITATPDAGKELAAWTGGAVGNANPLKVIMNQNLVINATFQNKTAIIGCDSALDLTPIDNFYGSTDAKSVLPASLKLNAGVLTAPWTLAKMTKPGDWDTYVEIGHEVLPSFDGLLNVTFSYKSDKNFIVQLASTDVIDYAFHRKSLSPTSDWVEMNIPVSGFLQPSDWGVKVGAINLLHVDRILFTCDEDPTSTAITGTFELKNVKLCGLSKLENINDVTKSTDAITIHAYNHNLKINSASTGTYSINVYSIDGKVIRSESINLTKGQNTYALDNSIPNSIYLIKLQNATDMHIQKVLVK